jgi:hypothetical protein
MIPKDKNDEESIRLLHLATDGEVVENIVQLLEWLQDVNWPVSKGVISRLSNLGGELYTPINEILTGNDSIWKANIIGHLIPSFSQEAQLLYTASLEILLEEYNENDLREGVIDFVEIQLSNASKNT